MSQWPKPAQPSAHPLISSGPARTPAQAQSSDASTLATQALLQNLLASPTPTFNKRLPTRRFTYQRRNSATTYDTTALLEQLIAAPIPPRHGLQPVILRSASEQRRYVLTQRVERRWLDRLLARLQHALLISAVLVGSYWLLDGPIRDWVHMQIHPIHSIPATAALHLPTAVPLAVTHSMSPARPSANPALAESDAIALQRGRIARPIAQPARPSANPALAESDTIALQRSRLAKPVLPFTRPAPPSSSQPSHMQIPTIALDSPVVEVGVVDGEWQVADYAVGYMRGTGRPGVPGNMAFGGHAGLRGGVFANIGALEPGADIFVDADSWRFHYRVRAQMIAEPNQIELLDPTPSATMTLITCTNWDTQRIVVFADFDEAQPLA